MLVYNGTLEYHMDVFSAYKLKLQIYCIWTIQGLLYCWYTEVFFMKRISDTWNPLPDTQKIYFKQLLC